MEVAGMNGLRNAALAVLMLMAGPLFAQTASAVLSAQTAPAVPSPGPAPAPYPPAKPATYSEDDVLGAAEDAFGKGTEGLAESVRRTFADKGQPNGYIVGREAGGALILGLRYGSGTLYHKVEGEQKIHWTGPSVGLDVGGSGSKVFALVYNLYDTEDIFRRFPAVEGKAYLIGGVSVNYLERDGITVVPMKLGVGWRIGLNAGYMKFSKKGKVIPF